MDALNFPTYAFKVRVEGDQKQIFDEIRKKYIALTPEEWVRQHMIKYLTKEKKYPSGLFAIETGLKYNKLQKRTDLVVYKRDGLPLLLVECKAPGVTINEKPFNQIASYNKKLQSKYLIVTNGISHYCCEIDYSNGKLEFLDNIPKYSDD